MIKILILVCLLLTIVYVTTMCKCDSCCKKEYFDETIPNNKTKENTASCTSEDTSEKCSVKTCGLGLFPILDPEFNMREVAKQCLLLEDHMNSSKKRCLDCIRKHFLIIDGLLEEAISLEKNNAKRDIYRKLFMQWIELEKEFSQTNFGNLDEISKKIRLFRKPLVETYFNKIQVYDTNHA